LDRGRQFAQKTLQAFDDVKEERLVHSILDSNSLVTFIFPFPR
jgi:hypothetical protein